MEEFEKIWNLITALNPNAEVLKNEKYKMACMCGWNIGISVFVKELADLAMQNGENPSAEDVEKTLNKIKIDDIFLVPN